MLNRRVVQFPFSEITSEVGREEPASNMSTVNVYTCIFTPLICQWPILERAQRLTDRHLKKGKVSPAVRSKVRV